MMACIICTSAMAAATSGTAQTTAQASTTATAAPVTTPTATPKPKPTPKPVPTQSPAQIEDTYKAQSTNTTVTDIDKVGNNNKGKSLHFTATIGNFVKDSNGNTAGSNVTDVSSNSSSVIQIVFAPGTDITKINQGDTVEVWGLSGGVATEQNAFGGTIQEAWIQVVYLTDQTTGYQK